MFSTGGYIVVEDEGEHAGMVTSLVSSFISNDVYGYCFTFFYSLTGDAEAQLNIKTRSDSGTNVLWSLSGEQGPDWLQGQVCIRNYTEN